jgi:hypothetical protein
MTRPPHAEPKLPNPRSAPGPTRDLVRIGAAQWHAAREAGDQERDYPVAGRADGTPPAPALTAV